MTTNHDFTDIKIVAGTALALTLVLPLVDAVGGMVQSLINKTIHGWQLQMGLDEAEANAASEIISPNPCATNAIGFQIPTETEEDYDE